jgi:predicted transcriptional regulator
MELGIHELRDLGLSDYESRVYYCLIQKESLTATELAKITKIPRTKIYSIIEKLERKNFCIRVPGNEKTYRANDPKDPITKQLNAMQQKLSAITEIADVLSDHYTKNRKNKDLIDYVEVIKDSDMISKRLFQIENSTKRMIKSLLKPPYLMDFEQVLKGSMNPFVKGVKYSYIYDTGDLENALMVRLMEWCQNFGVEVRVCDSIPIKAIIFDDKIVSINLKDKISTKDTYTTMLIHHEDFANAFIEIFQLYYDKSVPFREMIEK